MTENLYSTIRKTFTEPQSHQSAIKMEENVDLTLYDGNKENFPSDRSDYNKRSRKQVQKLRSGPTFYEVVEIRHPVPVKTERINGHDEGLQKIHLLESVTPDYTCNPLNSKFYFRCQNNLEDGAKSQIRSKTSDEIDDFSNYVGKSSVAGWSQLPGTTSKTYDTLVDGNHHELQTKLAGLPLTKIEEEEIHERAENFVNNIIPDPHYYEIRDSTIPVKSDIKSERSRAHRNCCCGPPKKRHRKSYDNMDCYVTHENKFQCPLPEGTKLRKPNVKLVQLVAQAIYDSPDSMLQVHHVYQALQNRYPYFYFMNKKAVSSWRSSIRHALYQKWFRKVQFQTESIMSKGCYWALNTKFTPKEWTMPGQKSMLHMTENIVPEGPFALEEFLHIPIQQESFSRTAETHYDEIPLILETLPKPSSSEPDPILPNMGASKKSAKASGTESPPLYSVESCDNPLPSDVYDNPPNAWQQNWTEDYNHLTLYSNFGLLDLQQVYQQIYPPYNESGNYPEQQEPCTWV